jgi:20S proteasome subunit alpha 2
LAAVASGAASVGLKATNGVVLASEKKHKSLLYEEHSTFKIEKITDHIGMVYSGMGPDYRVLIKRARKAAHEYKLYYGADIPTAQLVIYFMMGYWLKLHFAFAAIFMRLRR